jgi:cardiolipin synthase C
MLLFLIYLIATVVAFASAVVCARLIFPPPVVGMRVNSVALPASDAGRLAIANRQSVSGQTGVAALLSGEDAFAARLILANAAVSSIDAQYYIWRGDLTGYLLLEALQRAANRGVRVRLLLDDNGTTGLDPELAALNAHPNVEVRLYNPFNLRRLKLLSYAFDFFRLNRRMHNKSFTVDGIATIMGGRNVGDEYFGASTNAIFVDLDVLAMGAVVSEAAADFDKYWAAPSVHPASLILAQSRGSDPISAGLAAFSDNARLVNYRNLVNQSDIATALAKGDFGLEWTNVVLVSDDPIKGEGAVPREDLLAVRLMKAVGKIEKKFDAISPYLVPGSAGVKAFVKLRAQGVKVRILTNSLEATDVLAVHAGYTKRRMQMLRAGVSLYELYARIGTQIPKNKIGPFGSSGSSLHAKTFAVDGERIFIGSFNFDPRSTTLNTEMGLLIKSRTMAKGLHDAFDNGLAGIAWQVQKRGRKPIWIDRETGLSTHSEPGTGVAKRIAIALVGRLPVEWLL